MFLVAFYGEFSFQYLLRPTAEERVYFCCAKERNKKKKSMASPILRITL